MTTPPIDKVATAAINAAERAAVAEFDGRPADAETLGLLAYRARELFLRAVDAGLLAPHGVTDRADLAGVTVSAEVRQTLVGPPIRFRWNFSRTRLVFLATWASNVTAEVC